MTRLSPHRFVWVLVCLGWLPVFITAAQAEDARTRALALLVLGRPAVDQERLAGTDSAGMQAWLDQQRQRLKSDAALQQQVALRAHRDAWGQLPQGAAAGSGTYSELLQQHTQRLTADRAAYAGVIQRAYRWVVGRDVYPEEIAYWNEREVLPYALLVACVEDWGRRNQPGLMVTAGTPTVSVNSAFLTTATVPPTAAADLRQLLGLPGPGAADSAAAGRNLVSAVGRSLVTSGGIHFAAAGGPRLEPALPTTR